MWKNGMHFGGRGCGEARGQPEGGEMSVVKMSYAEMSEETGLSRCWNIDSCV